MEDFYKKLHLTSVIISGGGSYGIKMLETLTTLRSFGTFDAVKHWSGTSVGSICALCMNIGIELTDIEPLLHTIQANFKVTPQSLLSVPDTYGLIPFTPFRDLISSLLEKNGVLPSITFRQLYRFTNQTLSIFACCIEQNELACFNVRTTPDYPVIDALLASCAIPLIFPVCKIQDKRYIDGGMVSDWAIDTELSPPNKNQIMLLRGTFNSSNHISHKCENFTDYIHYLLNIGTQNIERLDPSMKLVKEQLAFELNLSFENHSFSLDYLTFDIKQLRNEILEDLHSSILNKQNDEDE